MAILEPIEAGTDEAPASSAAPPPESPASPPSPAGPPFSELETCDERLDRTLDVVHERFGEGVLTRARHLDAGLRSGR